jgi:hypothetical protein
VTARRPSGDESDICPYCGLAPRYPTGGCGNRACTNFRLAVGARVTCTFTGVIVAAHDAHGLSYDIRLDDERGVMDYVPEAAVAAR